ncbi:hypothetical protein PY479_00650 [Shewanella sp. A32]|uniref:hypothetical protein n=1 Tax=Shewanella sp. A32 TaxID=3031327 RepID=UPI0023B9F9C1|nr:hypothetical protein [Shewanella sp. A32]MDF0532782.1 hypothetical protein [Shewanella sp. A32]
MNLQQKCAATDVNPAAVCGRQWQIMMADDASGVSSPETKILTNKTLSEQSTAIQQQQPVPQKHGMTLTQGLVIAVVILIALIAVKPKKPKG